MPYFNQPNTDLLTQMVQGGSAMAQAMRQAEAFKMQKEDRALALQEQQHQADLAQKKLTFDTQVRAAKSAYYTAPDTTSRSKAGMQLAALSPDAYQEVQGFETKQAGAQSAMQTAADTHLKAQEGLIATSKFNQAKLLQDAVQSYVQDPTDANANRNVMNLYAATKADVVDLSQAQRFHEAARNANVPELEKIAAESQQDMEKWAPAVKKGPEFRPAADALGALRFFTTLPPSTPEIKDPANLLASASGPAVASQLDPPRWKLANELYMQAKEKAAAAGASKQINYGPGSLPATVTPQKTSLGRLENTIDMYDSVLQKLDVMQPEVEKGGADQFFGLKGDAMGLASKTMGYLMGSATPEAIQKWQDQKQELTSFGTMMTYDFLVALSGKAVTDAERKTIVKAVGDPENMTLFEYRSALRAMRKVSRLAIESAVIRREHGYSTATSEEDEAKATDLMQDIGTRLGNGSLKPQDFMAEVAKAKVKYNVYSALKFYTNKTGDSKWTKEPGAKELAGLDTPAKKEPTAVTPKKGDRKTVDGVSGVYDGTKWVRE
jgi:hypothetical protein